MSDDVATLTKAPELPEQRGSRKPPRLNPVARNGYALVATTLTTSVTGVVYWMVAAHLFSPSEVGESAAALTAMSLLATVAAMNLTGSLAFLMPQHSAAQSGAGLPVRGRCVAGSGACHGTDRGREHGPHLAVLPRPGLGQHRHFPGRDARSGHLLAAGRGSHRPATSPWVLVENVLFALVKLGALVLAGTLALREGVYLSWVAPMFLAVPIVNVFIIKRLLPVVSKRPDRVQMTARGMRRFLGMNYLGSLLNQAYFNVLPLLVVIVLGSAANASFYIAWTIALAVDLVSHSMGTALTVEASAAPQERVAHTRDVCRRLAFLLVPGSLLGIALAPQFLHLYGGSYAAHGTSLLRLLMVASVPRAIVIVEQSAARARGHALPTVWTEGATAVLVLGITIPLLASIGVIAVGWAWVIANGVVACAVLPSLIKRLRPPAESVRDDSAEARVAVS